MTAMHAQFTRPIFARLRRLCLALPETSEAPSWGHPNVRVGTKTFCTFEIVHGRPSIAFRVPGADIKRLMRTKDFFAPPYARGAWISRWLDTAIDWNEITGLIHRSYQQVGRRKPPVRVANA